MIKMSEGRDKKVINMSEGRDEMASETVIDIFYVHLLVIVHP